MYKIINPKTKKTLASGLSYLKARQMLESELFFGCIVIYDQHAIDKFNNTHVPHGIRLTDLGNGQLKEWSDGVRSGVGFSGDDGNE